MSLATRALLRWHVGSTSCPRRLGLMSEGPRCRPPLPGDSGSGLRAHRVDHLFWVSRLAPSALGVNQLSRATWASVRGPAWSTICPERHKLVSQVPRDRPDIPGDPGLGSSTRGVNYLSLPNWALLRWQAVSTRSPGRIALGSEGPRSRPSFWGDSRSYSWDRVVDQLSQATSQWVRGSALWTRCPGRLGPGSEGLQE